MRQRKVGSWQFSVTAAWVRCSLETLHPSPTAQVCAPVEPWWHPVSVPRAVLKLSAASEQF